MLTKVLTYHVVAGRISAKDLEKKIKVGYGKAVRKRCRAKTLTATWMDNKIMLTDEKGGMATVTVADVYQSNGVIHVVHTVLMPI